MAQFKQNAERQARNGNNFRVGRIGLGHPGRYGQWPTVGTPHHIVGFVVTVIYPDHRQAVRPQGMKAIVDRDFSGVLFVGSMSFNRSRL